MAKETFERTKPHVNVGTIGHIDHGKTTTTAAILAVQAAKGLGEAKSYADIAKGGTVRDATKTVTIAASHVEYEVVFSTRWLTGQKIRTTTAVVDKQGTSRFFCTFLTDRRTHPFCPGRGPSSAS